MTNVLTVREAVTRARSEGLPISEYALRGWVKSGAIPVRKVGSKFLIFYPRLVEFLSCMDGVGDIQPPQPAPVLRVGEWR